MSTHYPQQPYKGTEKFVISMDIGTTQSAVCFAHLVPGMLAQTRMVTHWPGQAPAIGAAKTPTAVSYREGVMQACGEAAVSDPEDGDLNVAHWFKLHLHPPGMPRPPGFEIPELPPGVTVERAYADMMRYLMYNTQMFHTMTIPNGDDIWTRLRDEMIIVLATPNGWDLREQGIIRTAAVKAGIVTEDTAGRLLRFVSEAEASVHYALMHYPKGWLEREAVFAVVDAGGSTVDITVYKCASTSPLKVREVSPSKCVQAGGIFVNRAVKSLLSRRLRGSDFDDPLVIQSIMDSFERELKPKFDGSQSSYHIRFGGSQDTEPSLGIDRGRITISMEDLKRAFDTAVQQIVACCKRALGANIPKYILLVGGFGESPYLQKALVDTFAALGMQVIVTGNYSRKAAAEGATIGYIKKLVEARAARATFGGCTRQLYDRKLHRARKKRAYIDTDGMRRVENTFHAWVTKGTLLEENFAYRLHYRNLWSASSTTKPELAAQLSKMATEVYAWEGHGPTPTWCRDKKGRLKPGMRLMCTLNADFSALASSLTVTSGEGGAQFYQVDYYICVYFGEAELRASLEWREGEITCRGPVAVIPHDDRTPQRGGGLRSALSGQQGSIISSVVDDDAYA